MSHSVDIIFFPQSPHELKNKVARVAKTEVRQELQQHGHCLIKANVATTTAECPVCWQQRPVPSPPCGTTSWSDQPAIW